MKIILLSYINRSGSTFLSSTLNKHQYVISCPEADILVNYLLIKPNGLLPKRKMHQIISALRNDEKFRHWKLQEASYNLPEQIKTRYNLFRYILEKFRDQYKPEAKYVVFKAERLFQLIPILNVSIADNTNLIFLCIIRDVRAVYYSQKNTLLPETAKPFCTSPVKTALYWNSYIKYVKKYRKKGLYIIKYEDLVSSFTENIKLIFDRLGLSMKEYGKSELLLSQFLGVKHLEIHKNINSEPLPGKIDDWKSGLNNQEKSILEYISANSINYLGYHKTNNIKISMLNIISIIVLIKIELLKKIMGKVLWKTKHIFKKT